MKKKTILFFVYDGFADWETSYALTGIRLSNVYHIKTIALTRECVHAASGLTVFPDLDFFPETDLADLDSSTVAMLILSGGYATDLYLAEIVDALIAHCFRQDIPVAMFDADCIESYVDKITVTQLTPISFTQAVFDKLNISDNDALVTWFKKITTIEVGQV